MATASPPPVVPTDGAGPSAARRGALAALPFVAAYLPFALVIGSTAATAGAPLAGWTGSWLILGSSAQLAALQTLPEAGVLAAVVAGLLINARLVVYSASLARTWAHQPRWFRVAAAGLIIDPTWAAAEQHAGWCPDGGEQRRYFFGAGLTLVAGWSAVMAAGAIVGARLDWFRLDIVIPLCLLGLVGAGLRASPTRWVIAAAAGAAWASSGWPAGTGILAGVIAGCAAGSMVARRSES